MKAAASSVDDFAGAYATETQAPTASKQKPTIKISTDQADMVDQAQMVLQRIGGVYVRARALVHVVRDPGGMSWLKRSAGEPIISRIGPNRLRETIGSGAEWTKFDGRKDKWVSALVPEWVAPTLREREQWPLPQLDGISDVPVLRADGTIHDVPGHDEQTRMIFDPGGVSWPPIAAKPTLGDAASALAELGEPFCDFLFTARHDRAAVIALLLTIIARSAIDGCVPMFAITATQAGSGKGLCADACATIATGRDMPKMANTTDDNEMRKRLLAIVLSGVSIVTIDNVDGVLGTPSLDSALTAGSISDRLLSTNETRTAPVHQVFIATGNNIQYRGDLHRRIVPIAMDPKMENPEDRSGFRHPNLLAYIRAERPRLVCAALTLLRAYFVAGKPSHGRPRKGSFESWDDLIRGAILWAGGGDPLDGVADVRASSDPDREQLRALIVAWNERHRSDAITVAALIKSADGHDALRAAIDAYRYKDEPMTAALLGKRLAKARGRTVGAFAIEHAGGVAHGGAKLWTLVTR